MFLFKKLRTDDFNSHLSDHDWNDTNLVMAGRVLISSTAMPTLVRAVAQFF